MPFKRGVGIGGEVRFGKASAEGNHGVAVGASQPALGTTIRLRAADAFVSATSENHLQISDMVAPSRGDRGRASASAISQVVEQHVGEPFLVDRQPFGEHRAGECVVP